MTRRAKRNKKRILLITVLILLVVCIALYFLLFRGNTRGNSNVVEKINDYGYTLDDRDTVYMRTTFRELKKVLKEKKIDYKKYAEYLAKLYIIDLYTINNKTSKYDVGAFENCSRLSSITLPSSCELRSHAFSYCLNIDKIVFD